MLAIISANIIWVLCVLFMLFVLLLPAILCLLIADTEEETKVFYVGYISIFLSKFAGAMGLGKKK